MPLLEVRGLTLQLGGLIPVNHVDFVMESATITSLIGPNGAGKTTLFNLLTGLYRPIAGQVWFEGKCVTGLAPNRLVRYGIVRTFQNIRLFQQMTVLENILVGQHCRLRATVLGAVLRSRSVIQEERAAQQRAFEWLDYVGLSKSQATSIAKHLSYGDQRRLEIARALASQPKLLLLDEPSAGMNSHETLELSHLIRQLRDQLQLAILLIEHDMTMVMNISDRISVMDFGAMIAEGSPAAVQSNPRVIEAYLGKKPV